MWHNIFHSCNFSHAALHEYMLCLLFFCLWLCTRKDLIPVFREELIPLADIITPNQFELEKILDRPINTIEDAWSGLEQCITMGIDHVVLTSFVDGDAEIILLGAAVQDPSTRSFTKYRIVVKKYNFYFTGTGDLLSALILARTWQLPNDPKAAVEKAMASLQGVCRRTYEACHKIPDAGARERELRLIQSKSDIENPDLSLLAISELIE
eukprot:m.54895 g.54895  ORF g.54895 m.54895 type:complete len:210 (-) comp12907_c0_seq5:156-785(-)